MKGYPLQDGVCAKCNMPLLIERTDNIPLCGMCDTEIRKSAHKVMQDKKKNARDNKYKVGMKNARYIPANV